MIDAIEREYELQPTPPRVVGPGRREQAYLDKIARLERREEEAANEAERLARELVWAERVERGTQRRVERIEAEFERVRAAAEQSEQAQKRLLLALGALQRDNEHLRQQVAALGAGETPKLGPGRSRRSAEAASRPLWKRLLGL
jgi:hypothetical protein